MGLEPHWAKSFLPSQRVIAEVPKMNSDIDAQRLSIVQVLSLYEIMLWGFSFLISRVSMC